MALASLTGAQVFLNDEPVPTNYVSATILSVVVPEGMPAGTYSIIVRNPDATISPPLASAYVITNEASVAYVPVVMREVGGSNTGIQVQNVSASTAAVDVFYYDQSGSTRPEWSDTFMIAPGASATFYQGAHGGLPFGFNGSAVVQATAEVRVVVNHTNYSGPTASAGSFPGQVFRRRHEGNAARHVRRLQWLSDHGQPAEHECPPRQLHDVALPDWSRLPDADA